MVTTSTPTASSVLVQRALTINGMFLMVVGGVQVILELSGYFGIGLYAAAFHSSPYTIGFAEAHGLALIIGWTLFSQRSKAYRPANHILAVSVHVFAGSGEHLLLAQLSGFRHGGARHFVDCRAYRVGHPAGCGAQPAIGRQTVLSTVPRVPAQVRGDPGMP
ncbi:hypothetical protein [Fodinicola feengrottensis]|uniref:hypothetical protein n=1 Tax=Fodinicola feengrottensis TaxID=435914 RepID=UPI0013D42A66|nr:hypothetical protein [Fodinicola feengrottensis]